jgi:DNA polymerase III subunit epsilon
MRQIVLDTETTGLEPEQGHKIIEIGCVELVDRRLTGNSFHQFLQPEREIDAGAMAVHGITNEFLADKPKFCDVADDFIEYVRGAELIIHNAPFDVGFLNKELKLIESPLSIETLCAVTDTLVMAKKMHAGQRNSLDALCKRYDIDNSHRELHGALLDAEILADVYLHMTGGQTALILDDRDSQQDDGQHQADKLCRLPVDRPPLKVVTAREDELEIHERQLRSMGEGCVWLNLKKSVDH